MPKSVERQLKCVLAVNTHNEEDIWFQLSCERDENQD